MTHDDLSRIAQEADAAHDAVPITPFLVRFASLVAAAEREACAKVCEGMHEEDRPGDYAYAIRASSKP